MIFVEINCKPMVLLFTIPFKNEQSNKKVLMIAAF
jgi:hypothetical protein